MKTWRAYAFPVLFLLTCFAACSMCQTVTGIINTNREVHFDQANIGVPVKKSLTIRAQVKATPAFRLLSTNNTGIEVRFDYRCILRDVISNADSDYRFAKKNLGQDIDFDVAGYRCDFESMKYEVTTPDKQTHILTICDTMKDTQFATGACFDLNTYKVFYADIAEVEREGRKLRYIWNTPTPSFRTPGTYAFRENGVFHHITGGGPDIPYTSAVAQCVVDAIVTSDSQLRDKTSIWIKEHIGNAVPKGLRVNETTNLNRIVSFLINPDVMPEAEVPDAQRQRGWRYDGMCFELTFTPQGEMIAITKIPSYWIE